MVSCPAPLHTGTDRHISRESGTLAYEFAGILSEAGYGQSTVVGMGADPVSLTTLPDILARFENDPGTGSVVIVGEVGGSQEEHAAEFIKTRMTKPTAAYIAGRFAPEGKRMGHAGAIVRGNAGTYAGKCASLADAGVRVLETPVDVVEWAKGISV